MSTTAPVQTEKSHIPSIAELGFDPAELRRKYDAERDKRMRSDGNEQYREVVGDLRSFVDDPYIESKLVRDAIVEDIEVAVIGGGFGGLLISARLLEAGITNFRIIEKAGDFGGTWYWNRYPGVQCDIESYVYLPLLEEVGYIPKEKYSFGPEILEHAKRIGSHFDLYPRACFQTQVRDLRWSDEDGRWIVRTDRDDVFRARFVVMSSGPLNRPKLPGIPGVETFKGHMFHTSRWDYEYTGGDTNGNLHKLSDKRVAVIGTGATAIQSVPHVGKTAKHLYVFQRTPSAIDERGNKPTDPEWAKKLGPGWQADRNHNFVSILCGIQQEEDLVNDGWTELFKSLGKLLSDSDDSNVSKADMGLLAEISDYQKMNKTRARVDKTVKDPAIAEALKPWYRPWCKRPTFNDEFLPTFNRPNVTLVDTDGRGVERITETGMVVNGVEYEVDCLIFATGFEVGTAYTRQAEFEVFGRNGASLTDHWADGMKTYHGFYSHGFPNCFHMGLTQTGLAPNFTYMLDGQARHITQVIQDVDARDAKSFEATAEAEADWVAAVLAPDMMSEYLSQCTPGYYNNEGKAGHGEGFLQGHYGEGAIAFYSLLKAWREQGDMAGLIVE
ncbi:MAG: NAD(P)/FAD-dependent oxidoreductase [Proteobacteria bacterium]|nr:NAD(P)/FAD-dependent oxidoreductase [Pseudomonadota bacterium]